MTTLTTARDSLRRSVAALRAEGVTVSTIIGHDLQAGRIHYGLTFPDGADVDRLAQPLDIPRLEPAKVYADPAPGGRRVMVASDHGGRTWSTDTRIRNIEAAATLLDHLRRRFASLSCPRAAHYALPWYEQPPIVPACICAKGHGCRPPRRPDCDQCDWHNIFTNATDRLAEHSYHVATKHPKD